MEVAGERVLLGVNSASRPHQVPRMNMLAGGEQLTWVVPESEVSDFRFQGAQDIVAVENKRPNLCGSRNALLDHAFASGYDAVLLMDDDIRSLRLVHWCEGTKQKSRPCSIPTAVRHLLENWSNPQHKLGGFAPVSNWLYVCALPHFKERGFIRQISLVKQTHLRFDPEMEFTEDYDYVLQHHREYGGIVRDDLVLQTALLQTNSGGHQIHADRARRDAVAREKLAAKWPGIVTWPHPRKGDREVLVNWRDA